MSSPEDGGLAFPMPGIQGMLVSPLSGTGPDLELPLPSAFTPLPALASGGPDYSAVIRELDRLQGRINVLKRRFLNSSYA